MSLLEAYLEILAARESMSDMWWYTTSDKFKNQKK